MQLNLGKKIKTLRKQRNISQEVLAQYLGVTFQAVSKWENETAMPDITLVPAIAAFFGVSTDELLDFNLYEIEKNVEAIVDEHSKYWETDKAKAEQILRDGLKKYPGNDILLNCLVGVIPVPERSAEVIELCKALVEGTRYDDVKYDAYRIMAEAYKASGEYALAKAAIEEIPEIYFTKLQVKAELLDGEDMFEAAVKQKSLSFEHLLTMLGELSDYYVEKGEYEKARIELRCALGVYDAFKEDFATKYTHKLYDCFDGLRQALEEHLAAIADK